MRQICCQRFQEIINKAGKRIAQDVEGSVRNDNLMCMILIRFQIQNDLKSVIICTWFRYNIGLAVVLLSNFFYFHILVYTQINITNNICIGRKKQTPRQESDFPSYHLKHLFQTDILLWQK